ncbi:MAG: type II secretion system protein GspJ, partial [Candidatus Omnitrophica bacterium]|nr:type II secretion system protein GspJ [Candidatus Omnitrophota bacterium]
MRLLKRETVRSGFTLLELLLALALAATLTLSVYTSLFTGYRSYLKIEQTLKPFQEGNFALELIARDLLGALPPKGILAGPFIGLASQRTNAAGRADTLSFFFQPAHTLEASPGIVKVAYLLVEEPEPRLVRQLRVNLLSPEETELVEETLCRNVISFSLLYSDGTQWLEEWDSTAHHDALPVAVQITI